MFDDDQCLPLRRHERARDGLDLNPTQLPFARFYRNMEEALAAYQTGAEDLQQAFHQYLAQDIGVNEDVAAFVSMHADHREQANYVTFLDECHGVVAASAAATAS